MTPSEGALDAAFGPDAATWPGAFPATAAGPRTALPLRQGLLRHLEAHLARLRAGAAALDEEVPWLGDAAADLLRWLEAQTGTQADRALRLVVPRGNRVLAARLEPLPVLSLPYRLALMPHPMGDLRPDPLARHKGLSGPWRPAALAEARRQGAADALLTWPDGTLAETAIAAVAQECNGRLRLPPPEGRVASVAERLDLPAWAEARGLALEQGPLVPGVGNLWCLNALRGIWPAALL